MNKQELIERLGRMVVERTPSYDDIGGRFRYDEKLMKCNYLLARLYFQERHALRARVYLRRAEHQIVCFNETLQQEIKPINMEEEKMSKYFPWSYEKVLERARKRKKDEDKFHHWFKNIFDLRDRLQ